jgi:L-2-hydroxyglutarate oxidase LhgO
MRDTAVIIGAGVIGLACAHELARAGYEVFILEQHDAIGTETSARNSEVIHAGIYYPPGSLKATLCVRGKKLLYQFCKDYGVEYRQCGKLIVATSANQEQQLLAIQTKAYNNGVADLVMLNRAQALALEPEVECTAALFSPSTGIIDSHGLMLALLGDAERHGAVLALRTPVERIVKEHDHFTVITGGVAPTSMRAGIVINAAGLHAATVAARINLLPTLHIPTVRYAKGNYFSLAGKAPFSRLVYPLPEPGGLGVHYTLDLGGQGRFGPDVQWVDEINYHVDVARSEKFYAHIRRYWPSLNDGALQPDYAGIRPKLVSAGEPDADFFIQGPAEHGVAGLVNLFGIESPGLTSSLAIAEQILHTLNFANHPVSLTE